ncbi:hypothetical protein [Anaerocolumna chitinilytica]|uniref:Uncharacterized protein n=1 Tax=Anaerocolumna chitinilytica TaxID=1727145 RepID=A0A7I8DIR8_9FIRM|nr:hypothetical protein [Anaerocolumna chitinilytica]BCJ98329.1 hypothetical protein bsdcttw_13700 [Anaerocolumna chitinilytica]
MRKPTVFFISVICLLSGIILGFLLSPVKFGLGNDCGNTTNNYYNKKEQEQQD